MMNLEQLKEALKDRNLLTVSELACVSYSSVRNIARGNGNRVAAETVQRLSDYLEGQNNG